MPADKPTPNTAPVTAQVIAFPRTPRPRPTGPRYPATLEVLTERAATLLEILRAKSS